MSKRHTLGHHTLKTNRLKVSVSKSGKTWFAAVTDSKNALVACSFSLTSKPAAINSALSSVPRGIRETARISQGSTKWLANVVRAYHGKSAKGKLDLTFVSPFRRRVYDILVNIPRGKVTTYGAIARRLGSRSISRAVGTAVGSNPAPLVVPCHRVVPSSLQVGNYGLGGRPTRRGSEFKRELLRREGVKLTHDRIAAECLWKP